MLRVSNLTEWHRRWKHLTLVQRSELPVLFLHFALQVWTTMRLSIVFRHPKFNFDQHKWSMDINIMVEIRVWVLRMNVWYQKVNYGYLNFNWLIPTRAIFKIHDGIFKYPEFYAHIHNLIHAHQSQVWYFDIYVSWFACKYPFLAQPLIVWYQGITVWILYILKSIVNQKRGGSMIDTFPSAPFVSHYKQTTYLIITVNYFVSKPKCRRHKQICRQQSYLLVALT